MLLKGCYYYYLKLERRKESSSWLRFRLVRLQALVVTPSILPIPVWIVAWRIPLDEILISLEGMVNAKGVDRYRLGDGAERRDLAVS